jgi:hypothetical protein
MVTATRQDVGSVFYYIDGAVTEEIHDQAIKALRSARDANFKAPRNPKDEAAQQPLLDRLGELGRALFASGEHGDLAIFMGLIEPHANSNELEFAVETMAEQIGAVVAIAASRYLRNEERDTARMKRTITELQKFTPPTNFFALKADLNAAAGVQPDYSAQDRALAIGTHYLITENRLRSATGSRRAARRKTDEKFQPFVEARLVPKSAIPEWSRFAPSTGREIARGE